ncbi:conserved oligomeric Golgi complex subunit 2-like isoform X1 [Liolophura sinensis]|uniref:conserved oligomeric Golgi complex subunit 2-like isoform X1 n=1 Tax=Liolophura sinensis TaxID=3198878 RepID=UPI003158D1E6
MTIIVTMACDSGNKAPLPTGPANLCFDKDEFMKDSFNVDQFVIDCRKRVPLEKLRDDLNVYLKILRTAMIELINKDYADFVNLSTNLVGMDKAINSLSVPLGQLKEEVLTVRSAMDSAISAVEEKIKYRQHIKEKKSCLQRLVNITQSVEKIERLLKIQHTEDGEDSPGRSHLSGQLIERVATEFNKLQFYVTKSRGLPLVEKIKPRIANITTTLQYSLEDSFLDGLETGNVEILRQCLRTYALIDKIKDAENLFRHNVVKPYMEEVITEQFLRVNDQGLKGVYGKVLEFVPKHCSLLREVTSGSSHGEVVRGYDFLVSAVWPEVVSGLEARTASIFAPGNPNTFHEKYTISMWFVDQFENLCGSQASVKRLREHPSYSTYMSKWSLPVYFQIRFQEIAGSFESALFTAFNNSSKAGSSEFLLNASEALWVCLGKCWQEHIYLQPLCHRFWKLTLQLLSRYTIWLDDAYKAEVSKSAEKSAQPAVEKSTTNANEKPNGNNSVTSANSSGAVQASPPVTMGQIVSLIADAEKIASKIMPLLNTLIKPRIQALGYTQTQALEVCFNENREAVVQRLPQYRTFIVEDVSSQCSVHLRQVNDIPRLYRRTNREVPSKPSAYVSGLAKPLRRFLDEHSPLLTSDNQNQLAAQVFSSITLQYCSVTSDVLTSVKKMEDSLKRLKKARGTGPTAGSQGMSDDDKIRQQLILDIDCYGQQMSQFGVQSENVQAFHQLLELAETAKSSMNSQS